MGVGKRVTGEVTEFLTLRYSWNAATLSGVAARGGGTISRRRASSGRLGNNSFGKLVGRVAPVIRSPMFCRVRSLSRPFFR